MNNQQKISETFSNQQEKIQTLIGERIRRLWINSGEQQKEFVKTLGISVVSLSNYMEGKRKPDSEFLFALKKKTNVCLDWLLTGEGPMYLEESDYPFSKMNPSERSSKKNIESCSRCDRLEEKLEKESEERREVSAENRRLWAKNEQLLLEINNIKSELNDLKEENATLRERYGLLEKESFQSRPPFKSNTA